jgi:molybdenum transport protein
MLTCLSECDLERLIEEDVPSGDLTTHLLSIGGQLGRIIN